MRELVSELTGEKLAYWVARARGWRVETLQDVIVGPEEVWVSGTTKVEAVVGGYRPDINWSQCGELIEELDILSTSNSEKGGWAAFILGRWYDGRTPQEAICRAVVASVYGEYVGEIEND